MNIKILSSVLVLTLLSGSLYGDVVGESKFVAGKDYRVLSPAQPTSSGTGVVEVAEFFMYGSPHCYTLEPFLEAWLERKPSGVSFIRIPAQFNSAAKFYAKTFYAAQGLGVSEKMHLPIFEAIHNNRIPPGSEAAIKAVFVANGVDGDAFAQSVKSFEVDSGSRRAATLARRYKIQSVPTFVINGKYTTSVAMAGSIDRVSDILDYLIAKELAE